MIKRYRLTTLEEYQEMQDSFGNHFLPAADLVSIGSTVCLEPLPVHLWRRCICRQMHLSIVTGGFAYSSTEKNIFLSFWLIPRKTINHMIRRSSIIHHLLQFHTFTRMLFSMVSFCVLRALTCWCCSPCCCWRACSLLEFSRHA